jgi:hypothetical protein
MHDLLNLVFDFGVEGRDFAIASSWPIILLKY